MTNKTIHASKIPTNVSAFLHKAADAYGSYKQEEFSQFMWSMCCDIKSPIEQLFLIAINLVAEVNIVPIAIGKELNDLDDDLAHNTDLLVIPQWSVGKFKVDFALCQQPSGKIVCVELDGHAFHDRDERQRRYEKSRDRFLTARGYSVLHFTGAEVVNDPCVVATEAFNLVTGLGDVTVHPFEN